MLPSSTSTKCSSNKTCCSSRHTHDTPLNLLAVSDFSRSPSTHALFFLSFRFKHGQAQAADGCSPARILYSCATYAAQHSHGSMQALTGKDRNLIRLQPVSRQLGPRQLHQGMHDRLAASYSGLQPCTRPGIESGLDIASPIDLVHLMQLFNQLLRPCYHASSAQHVLWQLLGRIGWLQCCPCSSRASRQGPSALSS